MRLNGAHLHRPSHVDIQGAVLSRLSTVERRRRVLHLQRGQVRDIRAADVDAAFVRLRSIAAVR